MFSATCARWGASEVPQQGTRELEPIIRFAEKKESPSEMRRRRRAAEASAGDEFDVLGYTFDETKASGVPEDVPLRAITLKEFPKCTEGEAAVCCK